MAVGDIYLLQMQSNVQNRKITNNWAYRQIAGSDPGNICEVLANEWRTQYLNLFQDLISVDVQLNCIYVRGLIKGQAIPAEFNFTNTFGARVGAAQPNDNCWTFIEITDSNSSKDNGLFYVTGSSDNDVDFDGTLAQAFLNNEVNVAQVIWLELLDAEAPNDQVWECVVVDRIQDGLPVIPPMAHRVVNMTVKGFMYTQKRRRTRETRMPPAPV